MQLSLMQRIASLPAEMREEIIRSLSPDAAKRILFDWPCWARPNQLPPPETTDWSFWMLLAGRGFGKTRTGAEWVRAQTSNPTARGALVAPTASDCRDVMVEGESGL